MRSALFYAMIMIFIAVPANADSLDDLVSKIHSPEELEEFYANEFGYAFKVPGGPQSPEETLSTREGNCEDLARLNQAILKKVGIESEVVYIKFKGLKVGHVICAWKEDGLYNYFSNGELVKTGDSSLQNILDDRYSDLECCTACKVELDIESGICKK